MVATAVIGSAVVGAGASAYGASKASKSADKAAAQNTQVQREIYDKNSGVISPFVGYGTAAGSALTNRLGLGSYGGGGGGAAADGNPYDDFEAANPDLYAEGRRVTANGQFASPESYYKWHDSQYAGEGRASFTDPGTGQPIDDGGYQAPGEDMSWQTMERPTYGEAPSFSQFYDPNPTQQYRDELESSTKSINARAGATQGYYSGARGKGLQANANVLWNADDQRRRSNANTLYQSALNQYNQDRSVGNQQFDSDRGFGAGRYDATTSNLFNLLGTGAGAAGALVGAGNTYAQQTTANNNALAGAKGNAAIANGNAVGNVLGQAAGMYGIYGGGGGYGAAPAAGVNARTPYSSRPTYNPFGYQAT